MPQRRADAVVQLVKVLLAEREAVTAKERELVRSLKPVARSAATTRDRHGGSLRADRPLLAGRHRRRLAILVGDRRTRQGWEGATVTPMPGPCSRGSWVNASA